MRKSVLLFCLIVILSSCTLHATDENKDGEQERKIRTAKINVQLGLAYLGQKNMQRAKQKLIMALDEGPNIPESWYSMAYFLETTGDIPAAKLHYEKAIALAPERGDVHNNFGTFLCRQGAYKAAIQQFMVATKDPSYLDAADAYENAGLCALKIPAQKEALHYFEMALKQDASRQVSLKLIAQIKGKPHAIV